MRSRRGLEVLGNATGAVLLVAAVLGSAAWLLTAPPVTSVLVQRFYERSSGLDARTAVETAQLVRVYVTDGAAPSLPTVVAGRPGFDESASSHLRDVRRVLRGAGVAASAAWAVLVAWAVLAASLARGFRMRAVMVSGGWACVIVAAIGVLAAGLDFERFFAVFHGFFFSAGTWTFPSDSLLIQLFPEHVWVALGAAWAGLVVAAGVALVLGSRIVRAKPSAD